MDKWLIRTQRAAAVDGDGGAQGVGTHDVLELCREVLPSSIKCINQARHSSTILTESVSGVSEFASRAPNHSGRLDQVHKSGSSELDQVHKSGSSVPSSAQIRLEQSRGIATHSGFQIPFSVLESGEERNGGARR